MAGFLEFWTAVGRAIWGVWTLDSSTAQWYREQPNSLEISIAIAMLAGVSTLLGNSVVLFLNRVRGWRFLASLLINGVSMAILFTVQAIVIATVGYLQTGDRLSLVIAAKAVMLTTAPLLFGFLELAPYVGPGIARVLHIWAVMALWIVVSEVYQIGVWPALWITLLGWGIMQLLSWASAKPLSWLGSRIWRLVTGRSTLLTAQDLLSGHQFMPVELDFDLSQTWVGGE